MTIKDIHSLLKNNKIQWRGHMLTRMKQRGIRINDVLKALDNGRIIESYDQDKPYPSCLILGYTGKKPLHVLCSIGGNYIWLITTYHPDNDKWLSDFKTRRN